MGLFNENVPIELKGVYSMKMCLLTQKRCILNETVPIEGS